MTLLLSSEKGVDLSDQTLLIPATGDGLKRKLIYLDLVRLKHDGFTHVIVNIPKNQEKVINSLWYSKMNLAELHIFHFSVLSIYAKYIAPHLIIIRFLLFCRLLFNSMFIARQTGMWTSVPIRGSCPT